MTTFSDLFEKAALVGPSGEVHAFEPTPRTFALLERNLAGRITTLLRDRTFTHRPGAAGRALIKENCR